MASKVIENTSPEVMAMAEASAGKKKKRKKQIFCKKVVDFCGALRYTDEVACEGDNLKGKPNEGA